MTKLFTSVHSSVVQYLYCNTRMCVHHQAQAENQFLKKKEKKPHPDPDKIIMMLSPGIVLIKTQESEEVPRWSSYITTFSTAVISRPITCNCLYNFMFHNQIKQ